MFDWQMRLNLFRWYSMAFIRKCKLRNSIKKRKKSILIPKMKILTRISTPVSFVFPTITTQMWLNSREKHSLMSCEFIVTKREGGVKIEGEKDQLF